jgi:hypothetical protein
MREGFWPEETTLPPIQTVKTAHRVSFSRIMKVKVISVIAKLTRYRRVLAEYSVFCVVAAVLENALENALGIDHCKFFATWIFPLLCLEVLFTGAFFPLLILSRRDSPLLSRKLKERVLRFWCSLTRPFRAHHSPECVTARLYSGECRCSTVKASLL